MTGPQSDWDAATYHRISEPQVTWGRRVLERLPLRGDETVLDAGCGSGRVTLLLLDRLPRGRVVAVDSSESMVEHAREALDGERVTVFRADLAELELDEPVDAVFSNAVFHWIPDHDRLFERMHAALRPGGRLMAQCGAEGNVAELIEGIRREMDAPSVSLAGRLSLEELAALLELAPLLIANNTGPAHLAAAVGTPVVSLYALTNPQHTPWGVPSRVLSQDVPCRWCYKSTCPEGHHLCLRGVAPAEVASAALALLEPFAGAGADAGRQADAR